MSNALMVTQNVKTTIRWTDSEGNNLGAYRVSEIELPKWGKKCRMRCEIIDFINDLFQSSQDNVELKTYSNFVLNAFSPKKINTIICVTDGSRIKLTNDELSKFLKENLK